jgi:hypothetical protein
LITDPERELRHVLKPVHQRHPRVLKAAGAAVSHDQREANPCLRQLGGDDLTGPASFLELDVGGGQVGDGSAVLLRDRDVDRAALLRCNDRQGENEPQKCRDEDSSACFCRRGRG